MASDAKTMQLDCGTAVDRISNLSNNLIDLIIKRLPIHDAARMSILSKTWRGIWVMNPHLVFNDVFFSKSVSKKDSEKDKETQLSEVSRTIGTILLAHSGPIVKFLLCIPRDLPLHQCLDTGFWIKYISNNGVRKLKLFNRAPVAYKMPSYLFSCLELTNLDLTNCILNPPRRFGGFCNLVIVELEKVIIMSDMSFGAQLKKLKLMRCTGIEHLGCQFKYSDNLTLLIITDSEEIDMGWFGCMQKVKFLKVLSKGVANSRNEIINLDKLVGNMPIISTLHVDGFFLESLEPGAAVLKRPITTLKTLHLRRVGFHDLVHIQYVLCLIRSSPNLRILSIHLASKVNGSDDINLLDLMVLSVDMILDQLEIVEIYGMVGSRVELQFIKLLLASTPSLRLIKIYKHATIDDPKEELRISRELLKFPRASRTAQIIWT